MADVYSDIQEPSGIVESAVCDCCERLKSNYIHVLGLHNNYCWDCFEDGSLKTLLIDTEHTSTEIETILKLFK